MGRASTWFPHGAGQPRLGALRRLTRTEYHCRLRQRAPTAEALGTGAGTRPFSTAWHGFAGVQSSSLSPQHSTTSAAPGTWSAGEHRQLTCTGVIRYFGLPSGVGMGRRQLPGCIPGRTTNAGAPSPDAWVTGRTCFSSATTRTRGLEPPRYLVDGAEHWVVRLPDQRRQGSARRMSELGYIRYRQATAPADHFRAAGVRDPPNCVVGSGPHKGERSGTWWPGQGAFLGPRPVQQSRSTGSRLRLGGKAGLDQIPPDQAGSDH